MIDRRVRSGLLLVHLVASVGWIGAAAAYLAIAAVPGSTGDPATVRGAWLMLDRVGWTAVVPLAIAALVTGIAISLITAWGLIKHWWVILSLVLTSFATLITVLHMPDVSETARRAAVASPDELLHLGGDVFHPGAGLIVLLVVAMLNVYKPRGRTAGSKEREPPSRTGSTGRTPDTTP